MAADGVGLERRAGRLGLPDAPEGCRPGVGILAVHEDAGDAVHDRLERAAAGQRDDGSAARLGFDGDDPEVFLPGEEHGRCTPIELTHGFIGRSAQELHIPLLSAYACAVPAIMATRTIENKRERLATILIAPFMTCSARLPIYTLVIAAFVPHRLFLGGLVGLRALVMLGLYGLGFLAALITAKMLHSSVMKASPAPFILELPQYRWPTLQSLGLRLYDRGKLFLKKAGTVILAVTFLVWILSVIPMRGGHFSDLPASVIGYLGHTIEPLIRPLGFNWKIGIGLLSSVVAREVIVGTLGTLYGMDPGTHSLGLQAALRHDITVSGAIALVVFFAFAMQCTSTLAVVRRETNSWKFPILQFTYMTTVAYVAALITNQVLTRLL
jgi:ferrous iron transport protein B